MFNKVFFGLSLSLGLFIILVNFSGYAFDVSNRKDPLIVGTKQVNIHFKYVGASDEDQQSILPAILQKENLKEFLRKTYIDRFSSENCAKFFGGYVPYECNDQPVKLLEQRTYKKIGTASSGDLDVYFQVTIQHLSGKGADSRYIATVQLYHDRSGFSTAHELDRSIPQAFLVPDTSEERIQFILYSYITQRIL